MNYSRGSNQPPSASIRAGLSVQELKAMTAMRMATNDGGRGGKIAPMNASNSYQTATPEQLQAAGIQHVALNSQAARNSKLTPSYGLSTRPDESQGFGRSAVNGTSNLSPYHQQLLSGGNKSGPPIQSVQDLKALTQITAQRNSRAQLVLHGGNPSSQYASAISTSNGATSRPVRPNGNLQPLYGDFPPEDFSKYSQQQLNEAAKRQNNFRISSIPVTTNMSNSDDEESDFALNQMLADYERRNNSGGSTKVGGLDNGLDLSLNGSVRGDAYGLFSPSSNAGSDPEPLTPTNRSARNSGFSESFSGLSVLDRDAAVRQGMQQPQSHVSSQVPAAVGTRPMKLGMISKSQSQPLIPLVTSVNGGASPVPFSSPIPGRKGAAAAARAFLPELDSNSPHTSRETTPKMPASSTTSGGLFPSPSEPALTSVNASGGAAASNGMFPLIKTRSQTRINNTGSPAPDFFASSRRNSTLDDSSSDVFGHDMAESVLDFLNSTPTPVASHKTFTFTKDVSEFKQQQQLQRGGRGSVGDLGFTVSDLMSYTEHNTHNHSTVVGGGDMSRDFDEFVKQHSSMESHHHNNNEDDDAIRMASRQSSNSEMPLNAFSPRYSRFE